MKANAFKRNLVIGIMILLIGVFIIPSDALADFADGDFLNWYDTYIATPGDSAYMTRYDSGGNPDANVTSTTVYGPEHGVVFHLMVNNDAEWNPAIEGPIECVTFQIDTKSVSGWGSGQALEILVLQNGQYFIAPWSSSATGSSTEWHTMTLGGCQASDFFLVDITGGGDTTIHPDFSESGTSIKFGFFTGNSGYMGPYTQRYDNWHIGAFSRGDVNRDGVIDLGDVVYLITYLYKNGPAPDCLLAGDANCSGEVELGDVVYLITYLYKAGPPPSCK